MKYHLIIKSVLHQLGIGTSYNGYDYILYGITLIMENEHLLKGITKILYYDIAKEFQTSNLCVERSIRRVIDAIWKDTSSNEQLLKDIFGNRYLNTKPSNKVFLDMLHNYVKNYDLLIQLSLSEETICPFSKGTCLVYDELLRKLSQIE